MTNETKKKYILLQENLQRAGERGRAFSGGVDSAFLLKAAHAALGSRAVAVTATAQAFPRRESSEAEDFCAGRDPPDIL